MEKNGTLASPATALASSVLPVPGGPTSSTPLGMRPPSFWNLAGSRRYSMISFSSSLASSTPATSLKVIFFCCMESRRARLLPNESALLPPDCIWRMKKNQMPMSRTNGPRLMSNCKREVALLFLLWEVHAGRQHGLFQIFVVIADVGVELLFGRGLQVAVQLVALDLGILHQPLLHLAVQVGVGNLRVLGPHASALRHHAPKQHEADEDKDPEHDRFDGRIHQYSSLSALEKPASGSSAPSASPFRRRYVPQSYRKYTKS